MKRVVLGMTVFAFTFLYGLFCTFVADMFAGSSQPKIPRVRSNDSRLTGISQSPRIIALLKVASSDKNRKEFSEVRSLKQGKGVELVMDVYKGGALYYQYKYTIHEHDDRYSLVVRKDRVEVSSNSPAISLEYLISDYDLDGLADFNDSWRVSGLKFTPPTKWNIDEFQAEYNLALALLPQPPSLPPK